ncbi:MAG: putative PurR-regulated permease PerM [Arcticibacterium sp.]|jgi:predicted PurR-regulated permease PerM
MGETRGYGWRFAKIIRILDIINAFLGMRKLLGVLLLSSVLVLNSGFEQMDSTNSNQTELVQKENGNFAKEEEGIEKVNFEMEKNKEDLKEPQSIAERLGGYLVASFTYFGKMVVAFIVSFIQ